MSIHPKFDNPQVTAIETTPIVLRFKGLHPDDLGRFSMHDKRKGGDLSHVDQDATELNEKLFGQDNWKELDRKSSVAFEGKGGLNEHSRRPEKRERYEPYRT